MNKRMEYFFQAFITPQLFEYKGCCKSETKMENQLKSEKCLAEKIQKKAFGKIFLKKLINQCLKTLKWNLWVNEAYYFC